MTIKNQARLISLKKKLKENLSTQMAINKTITGLERALNSTTYKLSQVEVDASKLEDKIAVLAAK